MEVLSFLHHLASFQNMFVNVKVTMTCDSIHPLSHVDFILAAAFQTIKNMTILAELTFQLWLYQMLVKLVLMVIQHNSCLQTSPYLYCASFMCLLVLANYSVALPSQLWRNVVGNLLLGKFLVRVDPDMVGMSWKASKSQCQIKYSGNRAVSHIMNIALKLDYYGPF